MIQTHHLTSHTIDDSVHIHFRSVAHIGDGVVVYYTSPYAAQRTCIVIFAGVVVHTLLDEEAIAGTSAFRPGMKHIILDISVYPVDLHVHMVCYIAVA